MKRKIILFGSLTLLLAVMLFMSWDMFFNKPDGRVNPYVYDLKSLKTGDTALIMYSEVQHFDPALPAMHGIAIDNSDHIYICGENLIKIFDKTGKTEIEFAVRGMANCIHAGRDGRIYLGMQDHIEIFTSTGKLLMKWKSCGDQAIITSIAVTGKEVFIADAGNKVVYEYDLSGNLVKKIGETDPARGIPGFVVPSPYFDLGIGRNRELWVVNPGRHHVEQYDREGNLISSWGESSMTMEGFCGCCNPSNFALLSDGSFVTSEKGIERIKIYWPNGVFRGVVAGPDSFVEGTKGIDIAVDSKDRILALDPEKKEIRVFTLKKPQN